MSERERERGRVTMNLSEARLEKISVLQEFSGNSIALFNNKSF